MTREFKFGMPFFGIYTQLFMNKKITTFYNLS